MAIDVNSIERVASMALSEKQVIEAAEVRAIVDSLRSIASGHISDQEAQEIVRRLEARHNITMGVGNVLVGEKYERWLEHRQAHIDPYYWSRYRDFLIRRGFSHKVIASLSHVTDKTLGLLEDPEKKGIWDRRGLVVGHVQSGKTANYIGLINKAADAGYRLIIVIAGIQNNLRNQTQKRIDEGFVGIDSTLWHSRRQGDMHVGVGDFGYERAPVPFTNSQRDFNKPTATSALTPLKAISEPAVFVIKKNVNTLNNLIGWLQAFGASGTQQLVNTPLLVIDDEADNASINTSKEPNQVTRINGKIRELLSLFERRAYVGYTATPFANIFIDPDNEHEMLNDDLFPRDFIVNLDPPSNYFSPSTVFSGDGANDYVRYIHDSEPAIPHRHKKDLIVDDLPDSLCDALRVFVVARAIKLIRGQNTDHCSMLVNVSPFMNVQAQVRNAIHHEMDSIRKNARLYGALPPKQALMYPEIRKLHDLWSREYRHVGSTWNEIQEKLLESAAPVQVVEINSQSSDKLNYEERENGLSTIAIGGYSLSRGLTLEGLIISYFLRNSKMYDTLMQMGRWFGYRPGYQDLCRIWMSEAAEGWYSHISESIEQLRDEIRYMEAIDATPRDFGLKVRAHPDTLIVTARNKMGASELRPIEIGFAKQFVETAILRDDTSTKRHNRRLVQELASQLTTPTSGPIHAEESSGGWLVRNVPLQHVLGFISRFQNHPDSIMTDPVRIQDYVSGRLEELESWDVLFTSRESLGPSGKTAMLPGLTINCRTRTASRSSVPNKTLYITEKQRVASPSDEMAGLSLSDIEDVRSDYRERRGLESRGRISYPGYIYRERRTRPLLIVHLLAVVEPDSKTSWDDRPVVAWSISFPETKHPDRLVEYVVNKTWIQEQFSEEDDEERQHGEF